MTAVILIRSANNRFLTAPSLINRGTKLTFSYVFHLETGYCHPYFSFVLVLK